MTLKSFKNQVMNSFVSVFLSLVFLILGLNVYAALSSVNSGDPLTSAMWNELINSVWKTGGGVVYYTGGNVSIGTNQTNFGIYDGTTFSMQGLANKQIYLEGRRSITNSNSMIFGIRGYNSNGLLSSVDFRSDDNGTNGALVFQTAVGNTLSEKLRINSAGNIGIGNNSPKAKLDVNGTLKIYSAATAPYACDATRLGEMYTDTSSFANSHETYNLCICVYDDNGWNNASSAIYYWVSTINGPAVTSSPTDCY